MLRTNRPRLRLATRGRSHRPPLRRFTRHKRVFSAVVCTVSVPSGSGSNMGGVGLATSRWACERRDW
ncbi:MAG: hypothetical protein Q8N13_08590 [Acidovorax sp.]|nr:hypothetical protein [Acidovorax sp.]